MIKANELRIGSLIAMPADSGKPIWKVLEIRELGIIYGQSWETGTAYCKYEIPSPIPLTPEWLERIGFEWKANIHRWVHGTGFRIIQTDAGFENGIGDGSFIQPPLRYVHQLQNLFFALTGVELELKTENHV